MSINTPGLYKEQASKTLKPRFESGLSKPDGNGCIHWTKALLDSGYGKIYYGFFSGRQRQVATHRASWVLSKGDIPPKALVLHKCDVRTCVNPDHLFLGTPTDNVRDMVKKHRSFGAEWSKSKAILVERIKDLRAAGCLHREIAGWLKVSQTYVTEVLNGKYKFLTHIA